MPLYRWSQTSANNASADPTINWAEGQAPSSINDSARAMMAATAKFRDDISGAIVTGGTSTAYTVTSYQAFDTLAHMDGQIIAFTPHATNGATVTLNVDSLGAKPLRTAPSIELQSNVLILGTPYFAIYNNSDAVFYLHNLASNTYGIPLGAGMDYWLSTTPSSAFVFPTGQAISRTAYATLFSAMGTTYGIGDGSTTFNLPDKTERVSVMKAATATRLTSTYFGADSTALGAVGGSQSQTLTQTNLPNVNFTVSGITSTSQATFAGYNIALANAAVSSTTFGSGSFGNAAISTGSFSYAAALTVGAQTVTGTAASGGSGSGHANVQPTIVCNYILRVI